MNEKELFLQSDAALRSVIDRISPEQLLLPVPADADSETRLLARVGYLVP